MFLLDKSEKYYFVKNGVLPFDTGKKLTKKRIKESNLKQLKVYNDYKGSKPVLIGFLCCKCKKHFYICKGVNIDIYEEITCPYFKCKNVIVKKVKW